jgi:uncharacterized membrane protein YcjF (UPF0283 family)
MAQEAAMGDVKAADQAGSGSTPRGIGGVRTGDDGRGAPVLATGGYEELSLEEDRTLQEAAAKRAEERARQLLLDGISPTSASAIQLPKFLTSASAMMLAVGFASLVVLVVVSQVAGILAAVQGSSPAVRALWYSATGLLAGAVGAAILRLATVYLRFARRGAIELQGLELLSERAELRALAESAQSDARAHLESFVGLYDLSDNELAGLGLTSDEVEAVRRNTRRLLDRSRECGDLAWIEEFESGFLGMLDQAANRTIQSWSKKVAVKTAIVPVGALDSVLVLYSAFSLTAALCQIYQARLGRGGAVMITLRSGFAALIAGQSENLAAVVESLTENVDSVVGQVAGKITPKIGEGVANFVLLRRIGNSCRSLLRPIA